MEAIFTNPVISSILSNYPKPYWTRAVVAFTIYGINTLKTHHDLSYLTINDIESFCQVSAPKEHRIGGMNVFMKELHTIKNKISNLDKRINENKETELEIPKKKSPVKNESKTFAPYMAARPSSLWRTKTNGKSENKEIKNALVYPEWWPQGKVSENKKIIQDKSRAKSTIGSARRKQKSIGKKESKPDKLITPTYLKNVQSKILTNIEQDKLKYEINQKRMNIKPERNIEYSTKDNYNDQVKSNYEDMNNKENSKMEYDNSIKKKYFVARDSNPINYGLVKYNLKTRNDYIPKETETFSANYTHPENKYNEMNSRSKEIGRAHV